MSQFVVKTEQVGADHIELYAALSRAEYGDAAISDPAHLRWKFLANPQGPARAVHVFLDELLVGRLVAQPRSFNTPSGPITAAYMVDLVVHPQYRGMSTLLALFSAFRQLRADFAFVFVTPNPAGALVWKSLAKLPEPFALDVRVVPLRPGSLARRVVPRLPRAFELLADSAARVCSGLAARAGAAESRLRFDHHWPADAELDRLLDGSSPRRLTGVRDRRFLQWRFAQSPRFSYDVDFVYKDRVLAGYLATRRLVYAGYDTRFIVDAYGSPALTERDWRVAVWRTIGLGLASGGPELLMALANANVGPLATICAPPFVTVPPRFLPQQAGVFAQWLSPPAYPLTREGWELTLADCDMI